MHKLTITDLDFYIKQLCKKHPPRSKEDLKCINKLREYIESRCNIVPSSEKLQTEEILDNKIIEISYYRKDVCKETSKEYKESVNKINKKIQSIEEDIKEEISKQDQLYNESILLEENKLSEFSKINDQLVDLLGRINNIKIDKEMINRDTMVKNRDKNLIKYFKAL